MKLLCIAFFVLLSSIDFAQSLETKDVPQMIQSKFKSGFSRAVNVKWNKENSIYKANFTSGKKKMSVNFDENGEIIQTETNIRINDLPVEVKESVSTNYPEYKITNAARIVSKYAITFKAEVTTGKKIMGLFYDEHGALLKINKKLKSNSIKD